MSEPITVELNPTTFLTVGTIGPPGQRKFFLQGSRSAEVISLTLEKEQARALAVALNELLERLPEAGVAAAGDDPVSMDLLQPVNPLFRIGQMGLGYDEANDRIVIHAQELLPDPEEGVPGYVRFWVNRVQVEVLATHALKVVNEGRPSCPLCGQPIDPEGHFCPPGNGHEKEWPHD